MLGKTSCVKWAAVAVMLALFATPGFAKKKKKPETTTQTTSQTDTTSKKSAKSKKGTSAAKPATAAAPASAAAPSSAAPADNAAASENSATRSSKRSAKTAAAGAASDSDIASARSQGKVWVNAETKVYHKGGRWYGKTKNGKFMTEAEAKAAGYKEAKRD